MDFTQYVNHVKDLIAELDLTGNNPCEIIYQIDGINVYGQFENGYRGVDHHVLDTDGMTWEKIMTFGTLVVPETKRYISDTPILEFENLGYARLSTTENHIV